MSWISYYSSVCSLCSLVVWLPCDGPVDTHTYVTRFWCSFMVDLLWKCVVPGFLTLSKLSRLPLTVVAYAELSCILGWVQLFPGSLSWVSASCVASTCASCQKILYNDCLPPYMWQGMTSCGYRFSGVLILLNCWTPSGPGDFLLGNCLTVVWTSLSVRHSFIWVFPSFLVSVLLHVGVSYWLGCYLHVHSYKIC